MNKFDLRPVEGGVELRGGQLEGPMVFRETDGEQRAINLVGFLSQREADVLRVLDESGGGCDEGIRDNGLATSPTDGTA